MARTGLIDNVDERLLDETQHGVHHRQHPGCQGSRGDPDAHRRHPPPDRRHQRHRSERTSPGCKTRTCGLDPRIRACSPPSRAAFPPPCALLAKPVAAWRPMLPLVLVLDEGHRSGWRCWQAGRRRWPSRCAACGNAGAGRSRTSSVGGDLGTGDGPAWMVDSVGGLRDRVDRGGHHLSEHEEGVAVGRAQRRGHLAGGADRPLLELELLPVPGR